jgi:hypothetical protein
MKICFELSMPNRGSWNGGWSGAENLYARVISFSNSKAGNEAANRILSKASYFYSWSDGWGASVKVRQVDGKESASIKRRSKGFCGYDWMIASIREHGKIYADHQKPDAELNQSIAVADHLNPLLEKIKP